ncbi:MAG TPA: chromosomal replication initiator protein DnaA [Solirubrobacterales bacterium]|nr:chromosomal replication initiator protein DnaA [Solirubrobacterales bacterium]
MAPIEPWGVCVTLLYGTLIGIVAGVVVGLLVADTKAWLLWGGRKLARASAQLLPEPHRTRYAEEWEANVLAIKDSPLSALFLAIWTALRAPAWAAHFHDKQDDEKQAQQAAQPSAVASVIPAALGPNPSASATELWAATKERLRGAVPESTYRLWLEPLEVVGRDDETLYLTAPEGIRAWAERRYAQLISEAVSEVAPSLWRVNFTTSSLATTADHQLPPLPINPRYTFESFVMGDDNHAAFRSVQTIAEESSKTYNPLFVHGPPGVGKTHLLAAAANHLAERNSDLIVRYTTAESFANEFTAALKSTGIEAFRATYRNPDVLLIDDVQFLSDKPAIEEEVFHTINALLDSGGQLIITADRAPGDLSALAPRLRDRFDAGLTVGIPPPALDTRLAILRRLAAESGVEITEDAIVELASRVGNIRQLHGAFTRVLAHASLAAQPVDADLVADLVPGSSHLQGVSVERIQQAVAERFGISRESLVGHDKSEIRLRAFLVAVYLSRSLTDLSLPQIGRLFGDRDRRTVHNTLRCAERTIARDPALGRLVSALRREVLHR